MPHPGGHVGSHIAVELGVLDPVGQVVLVPGARRVLVLHQPPVCGLRLVQMSGDGHCHGGLHVVPRIGVASGKPRDHPVGQLPLGDRPGSEDQVVGCQEAG